MFEESKGVKDQISNLGQAKGVSGATNNSKNSSSTSSQYGNQQFSNITNTSSSFPSNENIDQELGFEDINDNSDTHYDPLPFWNVDIESYKEYAKQDEISLSEFYPEEIREIKFLTAVHRPKEIQNIQFIPKDRSQNKVNLRDGFDFNGII